MRAIARLLAALTILSASPANAEWLEARTAHFLIYANENPDRLGAYAAKLERFDNAVRTLRKMPDPALSDPEKLTIYLVGTQGDVAKLVGAGGVAGFYVPRSSGAVAFVPRAAGLTESVADVDPDAIFFHEYSHHLQLQSADAAVPPWVSEGFAEFFARTQMRPDGTVLVGVPPLYRTDSLLENNALGLKQMLTADTNLLSSVQFDNMYGKGWLLLHYLTFDHARAGQLDRYLAEFQQGVPGEVAGEHAFGDLDKLSSEIDRYLRRKTLPHLILTGSGTQIKPTEVRTLTPGEAAIVRSRMRLAAYPSKAARKDIAADARAVASRFPDDPAVEAVLSDAELATRNYAAARAAAARALATRPDYYLALLADARAAIEAALKAKQPADWHQVRASVLRANKLEPEAAEPLMLFYRTFRAAGEAPTKNAVDGLLYALALAPQDTNLRLLVVRQMLEQNDVAKGKRYFAAFAFQPHFNANMRSATTKAMEAMKANNGAAALAQLTTIETLIEKDD